MYFLRSNLSLSNHNRYNSMHNFGFSKMFNIFSIKRVRGTNSDCGINHIS